MTGANAWWENWPRTRFGSDRTEERLAALIIVGRMRATVWNALQGCETSPGMQWIVTVADKPVAVIETLGVEQRRFDAIDQAFARQEGEDDQSLTFWLSAHEDFFWGDDQFAQDMMLWREYFKLIEVLDPDLPACADQHVALEQAEGEAMVAAIAGASRNLP